MCPRNVSEEVPAVVNIKTQKTRLIAHKFETGWFVGVVKGLETKKQVAYTINVCVSLYYS